MTICEEPRFVEIFKMIRGFFFSSGLEVVEIEAI